MAILISCFDWLNVIYMLNYYCCIDGYIMPLIPSPPCTHIHIHNTHACMHMQTHMYTHIHTAYTLACNYTHTYTHVHTHTDTHNTDVHTIYTYRQTCLKTLW